MRARIRLQWVMVMIVISMFYGALIAYDSSIASAVAVGYIALVLTIFVVINIWKKP